MSFTVFMALCILGLDLLMYVLFHRIYGDKRGAVARQVAAFKGQSPNHSGSFHKRPVRGKNLGAIRVRLESVRRRSPELTAKLSLGRLLRSRSIYFAKSCQRSG
jgi:hypothetical protein